MLLVLLISSFLCFFASMRNRRINKKFNYNMIFIAMGTLYFAGPLLANYVGIIANKDIEDYWYLPVSAIIAMISFTLANRVTYKTKTTEYGVYNHQRIKGMLLCWLLLYFLVELYIFHGIGWNAYLVYGRAAAKQMIGRQFGRLTLAESLPNIVAVLSFELYFREKERNHRTDRVYRNLGLISAGAALFMAVVRVDRSDFLTILLPLIFIFYFHEKIEFRDLILMGFGLLLLFSAWKIIIPALLRGDVDAVRSYSLAVPGETYAWFDVGKDVMNFIKNGNMEYKLGHSYLKAFESIINPLFQSYESLSTWYVRTFYEDVYLAGGGRGFSCIIEALMNFGFFGPMIVFFYIGTFISWLEQKMKQSPFYSTFYALMMGGVYKLFRSEVYSIVKLSFWTFAVPLFFIWLAGRKKRRGL